MKKNLLILLCVIIPQLCFSQIHAVTITHNRFTTSFDTILHYPVLVKWTIKKTDLTCPTTKIPRNAGMAPDPLLKKYTSLDKYYKGSGYDKGHNMPAADNECSKSDMNDCFYFSNMTPQLPNLNRITWEHLEVYTRDLATKYGAVQVWCGSYGDSKKIGVVSVPTYCWKVLKYNNTIEVYLFPNNSNVSQHEYTFYKSTLDVVRKQTGLPLKDIK